ncbi:MAG: class I SAM-dependent methyltransferase [Sphingomonadales bacterium]|jgi:SAM-dependent methyltransferase
MSTAHATTVAQHWDRHVTTAADRVNWWSSDACTAAYNERVCGRAVPGNSLGCRLALSAAAGRPLASGVSVGAGVGQKERALLVDGIVGHMRMWELSERRAAEARARASADGVADRLDARVGNAFVEDKAHYDLVTWDHSLHHMPDVDAALAWSIDRLNPGGWLMINDYFGPNRLQWRRHEVDRCNAVLDAINAAHGTRLRRVRYSNIISRLRMRRRDPSEAPHSESMADAVHRHLGVAVTPVGGLAINILGGILVPAFPDDHPAIARMVAADKAALADGEWHFGFALWQKPA